MADCSWDLVCLGRWGGSCGGVVVVGSGWAGTSGAGVGVGVGVGVGMGVSLGATGCRLSFCFARAACAAACFSWVLLRFLAFF